MAKKYTIKKNRPIVKCPKCGNKHIKDTMCLNCVDIKDREKRYGKIV